MTFDIDETPNIYDPLQNPENDDLITFSNVSDQVMFSVGDVEYTFSLIGFGDSASSLQSSFRSSECNSNTTQLWAQVSSRSSVREPSTMILFGAGLASIAGLRKRRK